MSSLISPTSSDPTRQSKQRENGAAFLALLGFVLLLGANLIIGIFALFVHAFGCGERYPNPSDVVWYCSPASMIGHLLLTLLSLLVAGWGATLMIRRRYQRGAAIMAIPLLITIMWVIIMILA